MYICSIIMLETLGITLKMYDEKLIENKKNKLNLEFNEGEMLNSNNV